MNKAHKAMLIELLDKYGKDLIIAEIENILNPLEKSEIKATIKKRGRIPTRSPQALFAVYSLVTKVMWQHNLNISRACKKLATYKVTIEGNEVVTKLAKGDDAIGYDEKNIRQWFYDAKKYQKENPNSTYGGKIALCDAYYKSLKPYLEINKEMELIAEKYNLKK